MARVLIVDDDLDLQDALADAVRLEGHEVRVASNGLEGLVALRSHPIDLIILDMMMPVMDGRAFRAEQQRDPQLAGVPVVVVSASLPIPDVGAAETLPKPVDLEVLFAAVARHALRTRPHAHEKSRAAPVSSAYGG